MKSMKVFPFSFFKLLKFIIVSFHLALILFVLRIVSIYFSPYIFIWFEYTVIRYVSLWSSYRRCDCGCGHGTYIVFKKPKMLLPRTFFFCWFILHFFSCDVWCCCQKKWKKSDMYFLCDTFDCYLVFAVVVGSCACVNLL